MFTRKRSGPWIDPEEHLLYHAFTKLLAFYYNPLMALVQVVHKPWGNHLFHGGFVMYNREELYA